MTGNPLRWLCAHVFRQRQGFRCLFASILMAAALSVTAAANPLEGTDCFSPDVARRVAGCSALLESKQFDDATRAAIFAQRALAYAIMGQNETAIGDYNTSLTLDPNSSIVRNNRAWSLYKLGRGAIGRADVEMALQLDPTSEHAYDTRAHIRHEAGEADGALDDYRRAMRFGGPRMVKLYQCGLQSHGLYSGPLSGLESDELHFALEACVKRRTCDPLPADEECRPSTS